MTHYETIFKRRSVRMYDETPLDDKAMAEVRRAIKRLTPLYHNIRTKIDIVDDIGIPDMFITTAPHFILFSSQNKANKNMNAGYLIAQLTLSLTAIGLGSCIVAAHRPAQEIIEGQNIGEYIIMMSFGRPAEPLLRENISEFTRMPGEEFLVKGEYTELIEACRLAPSGRNVQPWRMINEGDRVHIYSKKIKNPRRPIYETLDSFDLGILLYYAVIAARANELDGLLEFTVEGSKLAPEGYYYITSII